MNKKNVTLVTLASVLCLGLIGCNNSHKNNEVAVESDQSIEVQNTNVNNGDLPDSNRATRLASEELNYIFNMTAEDVLKIFGDDADIIEEDYLTLLEYGYDTWANIDNETGKVYNLATNTNDMTHVRDIKIGDTYNSVIEKFEDTNSLIQLDTSFDDEDKIEYKVLYGDYSGDSYLDDVIQNHGVINYINGEVSSIKYVADNYYVLINIVDDIVDSIDYGLVEG